MHRFVLTSRWRLDPTSAEQVWQLLTDVESWPQWWRHVRHARVLSRGRPDHVGDVAAIDWSSALGYGLRLRVVTTLAERARALEARAEGDVRGHGTWLIEPAAGGAVDVTYRWDVTLHRAWMRRLAFLLRPLFEWNHFAVMRSGARGMARRLGCRLASLHESTGSGWP
jgi:ribosome-associated toxin RatA of RatAB toxin-antitoxin module